MNVVNLSAKFASFVEQWSPKIVGEVNGCYVKLDTETTREYFCPFRSGETTLIVVGFVGHLKTAGTRRRRN